MVKNFVRLIRISMGLALLAAVGPAAVAQTPSPATEAPFIAENAAAMDMARSLLRYGHNEQLRRLAQEIIVTQQQEIATMRLAIGQPLPPAPSSDPAATPDHSSHNSMHMK